MDNMGIVTALIASVLASFTLGAVVMLLVQNKQRNCFHHEPRSRETYIASTLVDLGRKKLWWCTECKQRWIP